MKLYFNSKTVYISYVTEIYNIVITSSLPRAGLGSVEGESPRMIFQNLFTRHVMRELSLRSSTTLESSDSSSDR